MPRLPSAVSRRLERIRARRAASAPRRRRRAAKFQFGMQWVLLAVLVAVGGFILYTSSLSVLHRPIESAVSVSDPLFRESVGPLLGAEFLEGNKVEPLINGQEIFPSMLAAIREAKRSINLESYIWASGKVSDAFCDALIERARHGVKVHVMVDGAGDLKLRLADMERLKDAGVEFVVYGREHWYRIKLDANHRTHRKLLIVDGVVGFTGGACIDDSWLGNGDDRKHWRETQARVTGPVVRQMQAVFAANWLQTTSRLLTGPDYFPETPARGTALAHCFMSGPDEKPENARLSYLLAIASARKSIRLSHAYFVPDELAIEMLLAARARGVKIDVIVPFQNDSRFGRAASRSRWDRLLAAGVQFHYYMPSLYHCKVMIVDDTYVTVGSINFDNRSFSINDEVNVTVLDDATARHFLKSFDEDLVHSTPLTLAAFRSRPFYVKWADEFCGLFRVVL